YEHKNALLFVGGVAAAIIGKKVLESDVVKKSTVNAMAQVMTIQKDAEETFQNMKEDAEDICHDAEELNKKEIYVEDKSKK
ncbi:DUF6110 family protein, partial [Methanobrevibacter sp. OttesenSCG-928-I08]|nr:DUF6110 family protein [Methanobrevibacter sp. OttesenSCG-928-I08]